MLKYNIIFLYVIIYWAIPGESPFSQLLLTPPDQSNICHSALGKSDKDHTYGEIFLDSVKMTTLRTATSSHNELLVSSTIIIQCNTGQTVYVKAASGGGPYYRADLGDFSVMLVKK